MLKTIASSDILDLWNFLSYRFAAKTTLLFLAPIESWWKDLPNDILADVGVQNSTANHPFPLQSTDIAASNSFWTPPIEKFISSSVWHRKSYNNTINSFMVWTISSYLFNLHFWVDRAQLASVLTALWHHIALSASTMTLWQFYTPQVNLKQHTDATNTLYMSNMDVWSGLVDVSLNHEVVASFLLLKWTWSPKSGGNLASVMV